MGASNTSRIILAFRSGNVCAFPDCGKRLTYEATAGKDTYIAEAAHICGEKPLAARYDPSLSEEQRNAVANLIYLCTDHHTLIDKVPEDWPTSTLIAMKAAHESRVRTAIESMFPNVTFPELRCAVAWVSKQDPIATNASFEIIPPNEKIAKNSLSSGSRHIILAGLTSQATVAAYVESETQLDPDFPERLKAGFLAEYFDLRHKGHTGDELFELMCAFAQRGCQSQIERTAGLAVLVYLFEICDVFEK